MRKKVAFVVQRYGSEVIGGAESLARQLAERFVSELGWDIEVLTTTAKDYLTWANEYPEGEALLAGVKIRRFNSFMGRAAFFGLIHRFAARFWPAFNRRRWLLPFTLLIEWIWLVCQGPVCPKLVRYLRQHNDEYEQVFFFTYLYYPTLWGYKVIAPKGVVITTAHDELAFHFHTIRRMLNAVPHIVALNPEEASLVRSKLKSGHEKVKLAGLGIDIPQDAGEPTANTEPVALYLGRISTGKGVAMLIDWMNQDFKNVKLQLAGKVESDLVLPEYGQIDYRGFVTEEEKARLIDHASLLINPSAHESLSLIVLEAMARKKPVLVNGNCAVMDHYAKETETVFSFRDRQQFDQCLRLILQTNWQAPDQQRALEASAEWVRKHYSWPAVFATYEGLASSASR